MSIIAILLPDFALILLGFLLMRYAGWGEQFWTGLEKLIYYVLFPALLFHATARAPLDFSATGKLLQVAVATTLAGIALGWLAKPLFRPGPMLFESGVQTAFRFNSYIALAIASRLGGEQGTSLMALIMGCAVPLCNTAAVHALAHRSGGFFASLVRNPLLLATAGGMLFNLAGLQMPDVVSATLSRLGNASLATGLITVGAGLRLSGLHEAKRMAGYFMLVKLALMPALAFVLGKWLGLNGLQLQVVVAYSALPTASSAYVLAVRMGGNGAYVAFLISASTVLSALTLPFWLGLVL